MKIIFLQEMKAENIKLQDQLKNKENEVINLNKLIQTKEELLKTKEEKLHLMKLLEIEIKKTHTRNKKYKENLRQHYENELSNSSKEINHLQKMITTNLSDTDKLRYIQNEIQAYKDNHIKKRHNMELIFKNLNDGTNETNNDDNNEYLNSCPTYETQATIIASAKATDKNLKDRPSSSLKYKSRYDTELHPNR